MKCFKFFREIQFRDCIPKKPIITVSEQTTLNDILQVFNDNRIVSAPVLNSNGNIIAIIDMMDIEFVGLNLENQQKLLSIDPRKFSSILDAGGKLFSDSSAGSILSNRPNKLLTVRETDPCSKAIEHFNDTITKLFILDERGEVVNLVSQSDLLQLVAQNIHFLEDTKFKPVESIGVCSKIKISFTSDTRIANFSISNLKGLNKDNFSELMLPVLDYLQFQNIKEKKNRLFCLKENSFHPISCFPSETIENAINKLVASKVHRLWVTDISGRPYSMISIDNILKQVTMSIMELEP
eukprot:gene13615-16571_t